MQAQRSHGALTGLLLKPVRHEPLQATPHAAAQAGFGLIGDCHAQPLGPRQVLVVRAEALRDLQAAAWQVRANLTVEGLPTHALESGRVLRVGHNALVRITHECEICSALRQYVDQETYRRLPGRRGSLGVILSGGTMQVGDSVEVLDERWPQVPEQIGARAAWVVARIPVGKVLTYDRLLVLIGGKRAHYRVLPTYLKRAAAQGLPAHRVLTSAGAVSRHMANQPARLRAEGVELRDDGTLSRPSDLWDAEQLYLSAAA